MMKKLLIEKVSIGTSKEGETNKRKWKVTQVGIKIGGEWHNAGLFKESEVDLVKEHEGKELAVELYQEEYNGKMYNKFKLPSRLDLLEQRVEELESFCFNPSTHPGGPKVDTNTDIPDIPPLPDEPPPEDDLPF